MAAGFLSLAVAYPEVLVTNDYWRRQHPEMVEKAEQSAIGRLWSPGTDAPEFDEAMKPYLSDPFRGVKDRRWLAHDQPGLEIEIKACCIALDEAKLDVEDIDLLICSSFFPDTIGTGNAAFVAEALKLKGQAWNLESACSSSTTAFTTACALVASGQHRRILCVSSCSYSKRAGPENPISWVNGDGAAAFVIGDVGEGRGYLSTGGRHTGETCGAIYQEIVQTADGGFGLDMRVDRSANRLLRTSAKPLVINAVTEALNRADLSIDDVSAFIVNTPTAWYADFCADVLGVSRDKVENTHPLYANTGPVLMPTNLLHAAHEGKLKDGDVVVLYSVGSVSSARAVVIRWSSCGLGALPPSSDTLTELDA